MITRLALRARLLTIAIMITVLVFGAYSLFKLKVELFPSIDFPVVTVATFYPNASPDDVLANVTIPLEEAVKGVKDVKTVTSTSSPSFSTVVLEADFGTDMKALERSVLEKVQGVRVPEGAQAPRTARINPDEFPILEMSVLSDRSIADLNSLVSSQVLPEIRSVPGVLSADVPLGSDTGISITRTNGFPSLSISVIKNPDANTVDVANAVNKRLDELKGTLPADVQFIEISNQAPAIQDSISGLTREVLLGAVLAVAVIFAFLLSVRPTIVTSIAIPVSIMAAVIVMSLRGMSLNTLTLGGMAIAVGRVVDDSIVVMENIFRHIQRGEDRKTAALNATKEVALPITASTLTTIAVFAPLGVIGGLISVFFAPFALTITFALLASLVVALTIVPVLGSIFIVKRKKEARESWLERTYVSVLGWGLNHKGRTLLIAVVLFFVSLGLIRFIPISFVPSSNEPVLSVQMSVTGTTARDAVLEHLEQVEAKLDTLRSQNVVDSYQASIGNTGLFSGGGRQGTALILVRLHENLDMTKTMDMLRDELAGTGRTLAVSQTGGGGPQSNDLQISLLGDDFPTLIATADKVTNALQRVDGLIDVKNDGTTNQVSDNSIDAAPITRIDGRRAVTISGTITAKNSRAVQTDVQRAIDETGLPQGIEQSTGGVFANIDEAFQKTGIAMITGILLVYLVMVVTQRSLVTPFVIIVSLPLASIGALGALLVTQRSLGLPALIGMLMLIGLVVTNAIVLVSFVEQLRKRGLPLRDALIQGGRTRLRPILMTAITTIFVLIPLAMGLGGEGSGIVGPDLATVVIGGLLTATFLTLLVIPVVYSLLRKKDPKVYLNNGEQAG